jgi:hypothetical protein
VCQRTLPKHYDTHNSEIIIRAAKIMHYHEYHRRVGIDFNNLRNVDIRICGNHHIKTIEKVIEYTDVKNNNHVINVTMNLPVSFEEYTNRQSRGVGAEKYWRNRLENIKMLVKILY